MPKGVILEINGKHVIVLTKEGTFQRTFSPIGAQIGEEISYEKTVPTARPLTKWVSVAACLMLGVGVWAYWNISSENQVYAYVGIDINPSLELGINQSGKVLTVQALNDDAKALLTDLSVQGESVDQAVAAVAKAAASKGFVQQNADIVITASPAVNGHPAANSSDNQSAAAVDQNKKLSALEQNLVASAQKTFDSLSQNVHVDALQVSPQFHSAA
ncbi:MAG: hypothetical protein JWN30_714, partial [Bacilli bacterium]|nr:hypothetical protein [Bacilli bacterium]